MIRISTLERGRCVVHVEVPSTSTTEVLVDFIAVLFAPSPAPAHAGHVGVEVSRETAVHSTLQERRAYVRRLEKLPSALIQFRDSQQHFPTCSKRRDSQFLQVWISQRDKRLQVNLLLLEDVGVFAQSQSAEELGQVRTFNRGAQTRRLAATHERDTLHIVTAAQVLIHSGPALAPLRSADGGGERACYSCSTTVPHTASVSRAPALTVAVDTLSLPVACA